MIQSLTRCCRWIFKEDPKHPKHSQLMHPLFAAVSASLLTVITSNLFSDMFEYGFGYKQPPMPAWARTCVAPFMTLYFFVMVISRYKYQGAITLYEQQWACNQAMILVVCGFMRDKSIMVGAGMIMVSIDQILWYIDVIGYVFIRKFIVGVAAYIIWPSTTLDKKLTTTHHLWFIPLMLACLKNNWGLPVENYFFAVMMQVWIAPLSRAMIPKVIIFKDKEIYQNVNVIYESWKDVGIKFLQIFDDGPWYKMVPYNSFIWNTGNFVFYLLFAVICRFTTNSSAYH